MPFGVDPTRFRRLTLEPAFQANLENLLAPGPFIIAGNSDAAAWATLNSGLASDTINEVDLVNAFAEQGASMPEVRQALPYYDDETAREEAAFYGDYEPASYSIRGGEGGGYVDPAPQPLLPAVPVVITAAAIARVAGPAVAATAFNVLRGFGLRAIIAWNSLPGWLRLILVALGVSEGADIVFDEGEGDRGLLPSPGGGIGEGFLPDLPFIGGGTKVGDILEIGMKPYRVAKAWRANGVQFVMFTDRSMAAQDKHGLWKRWRPKKPIVLYNDGASDLRVALKAQKALSVQGKKLAQMLRSAGYDVKRA